jgi:hypothetical protein
VKNIPFGSTGLAATMAGGGRGFSVLGGDVIAEWLFCTAETSSPIATAISLDTRASMKPHTAVPLAEPKQFVLGGTREENFLLSPKGCTGAPMSVSVKGPNGRRMRLGHRGFLR